MKLKIYPSVMTQNQNELDEVLSHLEGVAPKLHFDVVDGNFLPPKVNWFEFQLSPRFKYDAHLMVSKPLLWIEKNGKRMSTTIIHPEPLQDVMLVIGAVKAMKRRVGLALKPETSVASVKKYLPLVDVVVILTILPGYYGAKYLRAPLGKVKQIKKINPKIEVIIDGGMNPQTIKDAVKAGADAIVSGSFVTKSADPKKAMEMLKDALWS